MQQKIKDDRSKRGLTRAEYGKLMGDVSQSAVYYWERGDRKAPFYVALLMTFTTADLREARKTAKQFIYLPPSKPVRVSKCHDCHFHKNYECKTAAPDKKSCDGYLKQNA